MHKLSIDHFVLTVRDLEASLRFYESVLGMTRTEFGEGRLALTLAGQKINLHEQGKELEPKAGHPLPGSADFCLVTDSPLDAVMAQVRGQGVEIVCGPVARTGATGPLRSFYFRDPDGNLIEVAARAAGLGEDSSPDNHGSKQAMNQKAVEVVATITLKEGKYQDFIEILHDNLPKVLQEDGCLQYLATVDLQPALPFQEQQANAVTILERWESVEALQAHNTSPHMLAYRQKVKDMIKGVSIRVLQEA